MIEVISLENQTSIIITDATEEEKKLIEKARSMKKSGTFEPYFDPDEKPVSLSVFSKFKCNQKKHSTDDDGDDGVKAREEKPIPAPVELPSAPVSFVPQNPPITDFLKGAFPNK